MRKRLMNISKRCMVAIMSAAMLMSSITVSMAFPVGVYAVDNYDEIDELNYDLEKNEGQINSVSDGVHVENNIGNIGRALSGSQVENNTGDMGYNYGTVENNSGSGKIFANRSTVTNNYATIYDNSDGVVVNQYEGSVVGGSVTNYFGGTLTNVAVTNNYTDDVIEVANQFYSVTLTNDSNITAEYGAGFTDPIVVDHQGNRKQFIQVTENTLPRGDAASGQITISPKENYKITGHDTEEATAGPGNTFFYELREDGGKYYLTIYNPTQALTIDPTTLGLVISRIQNKENVSIANVIFEDLVYTYDSTNDGDQSEPSGNVTPVIMNTTERMFAGKNTYLHNGVYEMYYRSQSNLTWKEFELLCSTDNDIPKNCYFTIGGRLYVLYIPAIDTGSETYKACLDELKNRPNGLEGPAEIANIFKNLGITCTDMTANQPEAKETRIASTDNRSAVNPFDANTMDQIATEETIYSDYRKMHEIDCLPATGGAVSLPGLAQKGLSNTVVDAIIRKNAPIMLTYTTGGITYQMVIPAGFDLLTLDSVDGWIDFATLIAAFGASAVE